MNACKVALLAGLLAAAPACAQTINRIQNLAQEEFRLLSEDLGGALSYHPQTPTTPLGVSGFDVGLALTGARLHNTSVLERASSDSVHTTLPIPTLRLHKGLPAGFDVGVMYASVPSSNIRYYGGELRYAIIEGDALAPALGVRGSLTKLSGVDQLSLDTRGIDLSISKGFALLTPYAGIGRVWVNSDPKGIALLHDEKFTLNKAFFGLGTKFLVMNVNLEADKTGDVTAYSIKAGIRF
jgi:hypothetical protein